MSWLRAPEKEEEEGKPVILFVLLEARDWQSALGVVPNGGLGSVAVRLLQRCKKLCLFLPFLLCADFDF